MLHVKTAANLLERLLAAPTTNLSQHIPARNQREDRLGKNAARDRECNSEVLNRQNMKTPYYLRNLRETGSHISL